MITTTHGRTENGFDVTTATAQTAFGTVTVRRYHGARPSAPWLATRWVSVQIADGPENTVLESTDKAKIFAEFDRHVTAIKETLG